MFRFTNRVENENGRKTDYILVDLESNVEKIYTKKNLLELMLKNEIQVENLKLNEKNKIMVYDAEKEELKRKKIEKRQLKIDEHNAFLNSPSVGEMWDTDYKRKMVEVSSETLDVLCSLSGSQEVFECVDDKIKFDKSYCVESSSDRRLKNKPELKKDDISDLEVKNMSVDEMLEVVESEQTKDMYEPIIKNGYVLNLMITQDEFAIISDFKTLFYNGEIEDVETFFDTFYKDYKEYGIEKSNKEFSALYGENDINLKYKSFPLLLYNKNYKVVDFYIQNLKFYKINYVKEVTKEEIFNRVFTYTNIKDIKDLNILKSICNKDYVVSDDINLFNSLFDTLGLPREWFNVKESNNQFKFDNVLYKKLALGSIFSAGLYNIENNIQYVDMVL